jgi:hypothetical protein
MNVFAARPGFIFPYGIDMTQEVNRAYDAQCTPDFLGLNAQDELHYRGRLEASRMTPVCPMVRSISAAKTGGMACRTASAGTPSKPQRRTREEYERVIALYERHLYNSGFINDVHELRGCDLVCYQALCAYTADQDLFDHVDDTNLAGSDGGGSYDLRKW